MRNTKQMMKNQANDGQDHELNQTAGVNKAWVCSKMMEKAGNEGGDQRWPRTLLKELSI